MRIKVTAYIYLLLFIFTSQNIFSLTSPVIIKQPHARGVIQGQTATFSVEATGDSLNYQWYLNNIPISGATDSIYTTPPTTLQQNENEFKVIVSNSSGSDTSDATILYVTPTNSRVTANQVVLYNFKQRTGNIVKDVSGVAEPLDLTINNPSLVDWSNNGLYVGDNAFINSTTSATHKLIDSVRFNKEITIEMWVRELVIKNSRIIDLTKYKNNVDFGVESLPQKNGYNFLVRTTATDSLGTPGAVDNMGLTKNLIQLTFTHSSDGVSKIYRNGVLTNTSIINGSLQAWVYSAKLSLGSYFDGTQPWEGIYYLTAIYDRALDSVEIAHDFSLGISGVDNPFIIEQPENEQLLEGYPATFKVKSVSDSPVSYRWQKNGTDIPGATDSTYTIPQVMLDDSGSVFRAIVTNSSGSDTSDNAILEVKNIVANCPDGITHYYHLEESNPPYKDTIGFSDGNSSTPPVSVKGIVGQGLNFSNQEKIDIPSDISFNWKTTDSFSLEFWMNTNSSPSNINVIIGRYDNSNNLSWWVGLNTSGNISFSLRNTASEQAVIDGSGSAVNDGSWHLIAAVRNATTNKLYLYIDGSNIDSVTKTYTADFSASTPITLGYLGVSPFYFYDGSIDEVAIYNTALSQTDVQNHYYKGLKGYGYCSMIPPIAAPTNLMAIKDSQDTTNVKLSWHDNSSNELGFVIQRKLGDSASVADYTNIDTVAANVVSYVDTTAVDTTKYTYRLYAYNADTVSAFSNIQTYTTPLPVELISFNANVVNEKVYLTWETATEINNAGFSIERSTDNKKFIQVAFIKGKGTLTEKSSYSYIDKSALSGKYYYRLKQIDFDGSYNYLKSVEVDLGLPKDYALEQNYPNPFNPSTTIKFALPISAKVNIRLYNTLGQEVKDILNAELNAGIHETIFNASNLSSGIYFYRIEVHGVDGSNFVSTKRMVLMK